MPKARSHRALAVCLTKAEAETFLRGLGPGYYRERLIQERAIVWLGKGWHFVHLMPVTCSVPTGLVKYYRWPADKIPRRLSSKKYSWRERIKIFFKGYL